MDNFTGNPSGKGIVFPEYASIVFIITGLFLTTSSLYAGTDTVETQTVTITAQVNAVTTNPPPSPSPSPGPSPSPSPAFDTSTGEVVFTGLAYPSNMVTLLKNAVIVAETPASPNGSFNIKLSGITPGTYSFGIRGEDENRLRSVTNYFTLLITKGVTTVVDGIFFPPTISVDKEEVKKGDIQIIFGKTIPGALVTLVTHSDTPITKSFKADTSGNWLYKLDTTPLEYGDHTAKAKSESANDSTSYGDTVGFKVGNINKKKTIGNDSKQDSCIPGANPSDLNCDNKVNLIDFSILAFWYNKSGFPATADLNHDGKINLIDFSIMAFHWTG